MSAVRNLTDSGLASAYWRADNEDVTRRLAEEIVRRVENGTWTQDDSAPADAYDEIGA